MEEKNITKYLVAIIIALIILIGVIFIVKNINKKNESECKECKKCEICEKYDAYENYLSNLKKREDWKFAKINNITFIAHEDDNLYIIPEKNTSLYKTFKDKFIDIPGYCGLNECEQGAIVTDKKIIDIFQTKQGKKDMIFVLDEEGALFTLNIAKDSIKLEKLNDYQKIINIYNPDDGQTISLVDIEGNIHYLNNIE